MDTKIAYCGLKCDSCPIHLVTLEQDKSVQQTKKKSIAEECFKLYGINLKTEDITDCDGCRADSGRLFSGCKNCKIRKCARQKNIESCAYCSNYICNILREHLSHDPTAQSRLEEIRHAGKI
ncbi:MAG: DUF3795 domain-containing protein [Bacteroidales bacterium]|nr:DUF3795 domain-containing protein [Bacteroidales bacterium]